MDFDEQTALLNKHITGLQQQNSQLRKDLVVLAEALAVRDGVRGSKEAVFFKYLGRPSV